MFKLGLAKAEELEIKSPTSVASSKKQAFQKNIYFCFIHYAKAFDCVDHHKLWRILKEMGIPDHLTCLLRSMYTDQKATVRTGHGTGLEEAQAGIKITGRNINNLSRYADDTTFMAESEEELKSLLMKVKVESEKVG